MNNEIELILGKKSFKNKKRIFVKPEDFDIPHGQNYVFAINELDRIQKSHIDTNTIPELFLYNKISLWWLLYQSLIPEIKKITNFIYEFTSYIESEKISKVTIEDNFDKIEIIKQICSQKKIKLKYSNSDYLKYKIKNKSKSKLQKYRYSKIFNEKINRRKNIFQKQYNQLPNITNKVVFSVSSNFRRQIFDFSKNHSTKGEYLVSPLMNLLNNNELVGIDLDYTFLGQFDVLSERINDSIPWFPIEAILKNNNEKDHELFFQEYKKIISNKKFQGLFIFNGISLWSYIADFFEKMMFSPYLPFYLQLLDGLRDYFSKNKPKAVIIPYETGSIALAIIYVLKFLKVRTIGLQHGYIYPYSPMYSQNNFFTDKNYFGFPLPDSTLVFGDYVKNLLIKNGYPANQLVVLGNPALFNLQKFYDNFNEYSVRKKLGIEPDQHVILFTSGKMQRNYSGPGAYDHDEKIWEKLLTDFGGKKNYFIILKPHPTEHDVSIYETIQQKFKHNNSLIIQHELFDLIQISSVMISVVSSSMFEALCFKKPVIQIKFKDSVHPILENSDVVLSTNLENLKNVILDLQNNTKLQNQLKNNSESFVKDHYGIPENEPKLTLQKILQD